LRKIRIVFVVNGFAIGGGEKKLLELVSELRRLHDDEFHLTVCSVGQGGPLQAEFENTGVRTVVFPKKGKYDCTLIWKVAKLLKEEKADLVQTTLFYADVIGAAAAKLVGIKNVFSWEAITQPYRLRHMIAYRLAGKVFRYSIAVSTAIQNKVIRERHIPTGKTMTIHYGIDLKRFRPQADSRVRQSLGFAPADVLIGTTARFTEQKGHAHLLSAATKILTRFPGVHFVFVGDGPLQEPLRQEVNRLGLNPAVHFLGFRSDMQRVLNAFDLFVLPSLYEGFPNAVLEAMACGLPVVATRVDGTPEAVADRQTGLLVPPKNANALADATIRLLSRPEEMRRMGTAGRKRVEEAFALEKQIEQFVTLYRDCTCSRRL